MMKKYFSPILLTALLLTGAWSCSGDKPEGNGGDTLQPDSLGGLSGISDSTRMKFVKLVNALPVPFDILERFSGAHLPYRVDLANKPENAALYPDAESEALNLGIYGADLAYMISQDKLPEAGAYLKSVRRLSDAVVVPSAFDESILSRYESNKMQKDSMQLLVNTSYQRIDSTLQGNDRLALATLIIYGGWIESLYLTTQHIGDEKQTEKNKVLFDMLAMQEPHLENIIALLNTFPQDSSCSWLYRETSGLRSTFPQSSMPPDQFAEKLRGLRDKVSAIRNKLVQVS